MQKMTPKQILRQIQEFTRRASQSYHSPGTGDAYYAEIKKMKEMMAEIQEFDKSIGSGLKIGRLVSWPQGDGQAFYFVTRIGQRTVQLAWLEWLDAWQSPAVVNGEALRQAVEEAINPIDRWREISASKAVDPTRGSA